jgi:hypothetical protein
LEINNQLDFSKYEYQSGLKSLDEIAINIHSCFMIEFIKLIVLLSNYFRGGF